MNSLDNDVVKTTNVNCPYCDHYESDFWGTENGFNAVKCLGCGLVYVNPRPRPELIDQAVRTGAHGEEAGSLNVVTRYIPSKINYYRKVLKRAFADVWSSNKTVRWLDVGSGFGEVLESVGQLAPQGSTIEGLEPMHPKAIEARKRGLNVHELYLNQLTEQYEYISIINIFSHIPDFHSFLADVRSRLVANGEIFIETGNVADMPRKKFPGVLSLPDHLVFSGESHIRGFLDQAGFETISVTRKRVDTFRETTKNFAKKLLGRPVLLRLPYSSPYRSLQIRGRLR